MLLIDGVKYHEWTPASEDEFERVVKEHAKEIFGEQSIYLDMKAKLKSKSGIGSIPDGYVIVFGEQRDWHIVELELSSHSLHEHIVPQASKFISGMRNPSTQKQIVNTLYHEIDSDEFLRLRLRRAIGAIETYKFLSDLLSKPPVVTIIIEEHTEELDEAISALAHSQIKIVEFQTFTREGVGLSVHAHLFEPLYKPEPHLPQEQKEEEEIITPQGHRRRITLKDLIATDILKVGQTIYGRHDGKRYEATVLLDGRIKLHDGKVFGPLSGAASHIRGYQENGWRWWHTLKDGQECVMDELRKMLSP